MNELLATVEAETVDHEPNASAPVPLTPAPAAELTPMGMVARAVESGASIEIIERLMSLQERWEANQARKAFDAAMIPIVNALFAVGLVSLPGMMTGQVLSGISPLIAAKSQIVVMTMLFGAAGIAAAVYLAFEKTEHRS